MDAYAQQSFNAYGYQGTQSYQQQQQPQQHQQQHPQHQHNQQSQQQQQQQQYQPQSEAGSSNLYNAVDLNGYYGYTNGTSNGYANVNGASNGHPQGGQQHQPHQQQQQHQTQFQQQFHQQQYTVQPQAIHGNGHGGGLGLHQPYEPYDPFQLGVLTGAGMHFNPVQHQQQYQQYYALNPVPNPPTTLDINNIHRPSLRPTISPADSQPGSNTSSHQNLHGITPERVATHSPDGHRDRISPQPGALSGPVRTGRHKEGPVKAACLSCRQKKAKCDGVQPVCTQCSKKKLECVYVKSKRGGARKKRETAVPSALQEFLKKLDVLLSVHDPSLSPGASDVSDDTTNVVREFKSRDEVFRCYYNDVHPFLPVMPPRHYLSEILETLRPESPFLLAAETIMVLVPHNLDPNPKSSNSKRLRTAASAALGKRTMEAIEKILASNERSMEVPQAFAMLSMWEWGNAGNLQMNRMRANQAIQVLMEMGVNEMDKGIFNDGRALEGQDWRKDMARRTWWAAYAGQMTAAIISGNEPVLGPDDPRVLIDFPVCSLSDTSWTNWINAMRQCVRVFSVVNRVYASVQAEGGGSSWGGAGSPEEQAQVQQIDQEKLKQRMLEVDAEVMELLQRAEQSAVIELVPGGEEEVVRNQQLSARLGLAVTHIHIHRQQAFPEVSLFSKRICGLPQAPDFTPPDQVRSQQQPLQIQVEPPAGAGLTSVDMAQTLSNGMSKLTTDQSGPNADEVEDQYDFIDEMWQPETYPENLPAPWFTNRGGAGSLYRPTHEEPNHVPIISASIEPIPSNTSKNLADRRPSVVSSNQTGSTPKPHKAWGVTKDDKTQPAPEGLGISKAMQVFPPGISLARCATAAHTIVRLEVLHRSAVMALWDGPPKWLPFCSCGLVTGAYAFLLLALAVHAENDFATPEDALDRSEEVEALLTNVKVILAGLEAYGVMWAGIEVMAGEVRAALEAASRLPYEIRGRIEAMSNTTTSPHPAKEEK